ncbi:hypothetical protein GLOIN_2v1486262 [Rhizophagus clarus]|nr:hypothetical protein GLOIN_2v1486262 [Rhizophagus clarus]
MKPERNHKKLDLLEFLIGKIDQPEEALSCALEYYNVSFKFNINSIKASKMRSLSIHSNSYYWVLKKYGPNSKVTQQCFKDILESRIWIELKLQENPGIDLPDHLSKAAFNSICSIYLEFCNGKIPLKSNYLPYLKLVDNEEIIKPLFEMGLPTLFGLKIKCKPSVINYEYNRPVVNFNSNNKRKVDENNADDDDLNRLVEKFRVDLNNSNGTDVYRNILNGFICNNNLSGFIYSSNLDEFISRNNPNGINNKQSELLEYPAPKRLKHKN